MILWMRKIYCKRLKSATREGQNNKALGVMCTENMVKLCAKAQPEARCGRESAGTL